MIQINGALSTSTYAKVILTNGTQAKNVFWKVDGAVNINNYSVFKGTIVANNGAIALNTGVNLDGRALTTNGALSTDASSVTMTPGCLTAGITSYNLGSEIVSVYPNPFTSSLHIVLNNSSQINKVEFKMYNVLGEEVLNTNVTMELKTIETNSFPTGIYFYKMIENNKTIQSGKLISQQ